MGLLLLRILSSAVFAVLSLLAEVVLRGVQVIVLVVSELFHVLLQQ